MKYVQIFFFAAILTLVTFSCKKKSDKPAGKPDIDLTGSLYFNETHCSDRWYHEVPVSGNDFEQQLKAWLIRTTGSDISKFYRYKYTLPVVCEACSCQNGYVVYLWTTKDAEQRFIDIGFKRHQ